MQLTNTELTVPATATALGRAGLLPFCLAPLLIYVDPERRGFYAEALASYALAILCFLVGIWWGLALIRRTPGALLLSNAVVIVAFFGHILLAPPAFYLLCCALFPLTVVVERILPLFRPQPAYYASLRLQLTVVATVALLAAAALVAA